MVSVRSARGTVRFGFETKSHSNHKIKKVCSLVLVWFTFKIKIKPMQFGLIWLLRLLARQLFFNIKIKLKPLFLQCFKFHRHK